MLRKLLIVAISVTVTGCNANLGEYSYCSEKNDYRFYLDFDESKIWFVDSSRQAQVASPIRPCYKDQVYCFSGYISIINPFVVKNFPSSKDVKINFDNEKSKARMIVSDNLSTVAYTIDSDDTLPGKININFRDGFANGDYNLCSRWRPWKLL